MITILWAMCCWLNQIRSTKPAIHSARAHFIHWLVEIVLRLIRVYQRIHCLTHHEHLRWTSCLSLPAWLAVNLFWVIVKNHKSWTITGIISAAYLHARGPSIPTYITRSAVFHLHISRLCSHQPLPNRSAPRSRRHIERRHNIKSPILYGIS